MGSRNSGRRAPRQAKIIRGTFRHDRNPGHEPEPEKVFEAPSPPAYLGQFAKGIWKKTAGEMVRSGILTVVDLPALELLCTAYQEFREAYKIVHTTSSGRYRSLGQYMAGRNSQTMPEYNAMKTAFATYKSYMVEFGLSPASRNRVDIKPPKEPEADAMEKLLHE